MAEVDYEQFVSSTEDSTLQKTTQRSLSTPDKSRDLPSPNTSTSKPPAETELEIPKAYPLFTMSSNLPSPPFIDVSGIPNFRSLGGYLSANGQNVVRPNLYYRCAHPTQITMDGLEQLTTDLGVKAIYDLRSGPEVARTDAGVQAAAGYASANAIADAVLNHGKADVTTAMPQPSVPSSTPLFQSLRHFTPVYATEDTGPEALARKLSWYTSPSSAITLPYSYSEGFVNAYRHIAIHGVSAYTQIFRHILSRPNDPLVFHCTAGKDRTGVFAAILLRLAGVDDETICWEYAITEPGLGDWRTTFIKRMIAGGGLHGTKAKDDEIMTAEQAARVCGSRAGNIRAWMTLVLDAEFGGPEKYLTEKCGFTDEEVMQIKKNLVVDLKSIGEEAVVRPCGIKGWTADGGCEDFPY